MDSPEIPTSRRSPLKGWYRKRHWQSRKIGKFVNGHDAGAWHLTSCWSRKCTTCADLRVHFSSVDTFLLIHLILLVLLLIPVPCIPHFAHWFPRKQLWKRYRCHRPLTMSYREGRAQLEELNPTPWISTLYAPKLYEPIYEPPFWKVCFDKFNMCAELTDLYVFSKLAWTRNHHKIAKWHPNHFAHFITVRLPCDCNLGWNCW